MGVILSLLFFLKIHYISRGVFMLFALIDFVALWMLRFHVVRSFRRGLRQGLNQQRVLIIGTGSRAERLTEVLTDNADLGVYIVGYLDPDQSRVGQQLFARPVLGTVAEISQILKKNVIDEVIVAISRTMFPRADLVAAACEEEGVRLGIMADIYDIHAARMQLSMIEEVPVLTMEPVAQDEDKLFVKRLFDLALTLAALPLLAPVMGLIALAIKLDSKGPVFFNQERVGLNKRRFRLRKFRTMVRDADKLLAKIEHLNEAQGPIFKIANDPRVTRVGRFLRRTSLDELPQFFNVLRGEMSLVGPRPMSLRDVDLFDQGIQRKRFSVKPGITCLWQISGRSSLPFAKWLELDLRYIDQWSLGLDIKILLRTIPAVLKGTGAV
jgi:exopolysaccharide biosynthesis polyprenyl glycosylphosphotransferase